MRAIVAILVLNLVLIYGLDVYEVFDCWAASPRYGLVFYTEEFKLENIRPWK